MRVLQIDGAINFKAIFKQANSLTQKEINNNTTLNSSNNTFSFHSFSAECAGYVVCCDETSSLCCYCWPTRISLLVDRGCCIVFYFSTLWSVESYGCFSDLLY